MPYAPTAFCFDLPIYPCLLAARLRCYTGEHACFTDYMPTFHCCRERRPPPRTATCLHTWNDAGVVPPPFNAVRRYAGEPVPLRNERLTMQFCPLFRHLEQYVVGLPTFRCLNAVPAAWTRLPPHVDRRRFPITTPVSVTACLDCHFLGCLLLDSVVTALYRTHT